MKKYFYEAVLTPCGDGRYEASFPDLGNVITFGDDLADAAFMAQDLLETVISSMLVDSEDVAEVGHFGAECPEGSLLMGIATYAEANDVLDDTMTVQEAADILDVNRSRIYAMMKDGRLGSEKIGAARMVNARDVMNMFNARLEDKPKAGRPKKTAAMA